MKTTNKKQNHHNGFAVEITQHDFRSRLTSHTPPGSPIRRPFCS